MVSLGEDDEEEVDYGDGPLTTLDFADEDDGGFQDYGDMAHDERAAEMDLCWQVLSTKSQDFTDEQQTELDSIAVCTNISSFPCFDKCECNQNQQLSEWLLDSGASLHYTGNINDFVEYQPLLTPSEIRTATSVTQMVGKGTVILTLETGEHIRIFPVYYVPGLVSRLLSLGTFLQKGMFAAGAKHSIRVLKGSNRFLTFYPRHENNSIYVIYSLAAKDSEDLFSAIKSVYTNDYETMHRRLAHPSKDVLQKARKHLKDFPEIEFPKEEHLCPGCALSHIGMTYH